MVALHTDRPPISTIVMQHVEEAAHLFHVRTSLVRAPHVRLLQLGRHDERIAAHLDGVTIAGGYGTELAHQALARPGVGEVFVATVRALEQRDADRLGNLFAIAEVLPQGRAGLLCALGWVAAMHLRGVAVALIESSQPWRRKIGLTVCAMRGVDPGPPLASALRDTDAGLRACALRIAGESGRRDLLGECLAALNDDDESCRFEAARSAVFLGDHTTPIGELEASRVGRGDEDRERYAALRVVLPLVAPKHRRAILAVLARDPALIRAAIVGIASAGDPHYVPWLIAQMEDPRLTRLAGEAFSFITGLDLDHFDLERKPQENVEFGPNDDPNEDRLAMDEDDGLPWPDPAKIGAWWKSNGARFTPGARHFMGEVPTPAKCVEVLKTGVQRQRIAAAQYLTLLIPGMPLFNTAAPAWRQRRLLSSITS